MATDLKKVLSISGQQGLFWYLAHANNGAIVESFLTKKKSATGLSARITALSDISIYTETSEVKLQDVLEQMKAKLGEEPAPSGKSEAGVLKAFFEEVLPDYDRDRFYVSHMKKVVEWYNLLREYASLEFVKEESSEQGAEEAK